MIDAVEEVFSETGLPVYGVLGNQRDKEKAGDVDRPSPCSEGSSRTFVPFGLVHPRLPPSGLLGSSRAAYELLHPFVRTEVL